MSFERMAVTFARRPGRAARGLLLVTLIGLAGAGCAGDPGIVTATAPPELDCPRSAEAVQAAAKRMAELVPRIKTESEAVPATVAGVFGRLSGKPGDGTQTYADYERERLRGEAVLGKAKANGCAITDAEKQFEDAKAKLAALRG